MNVSARILEACNRATTIKNEVRENYEWGLFAARTARIRLNAEKVWNAAGEYFHRPARIKFDFALIQQLCGTLNGFQ